MRHYVLVSTPGPPQNSILYLLFPTCSLLQIGGKSPLNKASLSNLQFGVWKPHMGHRTSGWLRWIQASWKPTTVRHVWHPRYIGTLISGQHGMRVEWHTTSYDNIAVGSSFGMVFGEKNVQQISCWTNGKRKMRWKSSPTKKWMICIHGYNGINMFIVIYILYTYHHIT